MKYFYSLLFLLFLALPVLAQTDFRAGYLQKNDGSRTEGLLDYRSDARNALGITFKENESAVATAYKPGELQGYGFEGSKRYESIDFTGADGSQRVYFMETLAKGVASLYFFREEQGKERYFLKKEGAAVQELVLELREVEQNGRKYTAEIKLYVGTLTAAMQDCPKIKQSIESARLEQSDLVKVFSKYNACVSPNQDGAFEKDIDRILTLEKGIIAGAGMMTLKFTSATRSHPYLINGDLPASPVLAGGVFFNLSMPKISEKLSLHTGLLYQQYRQEASYQEQKTSTQYEEYDGYLKAAYAKLPLLIRYTYPKGKVRPYLNAGAHLSLLLNSQSEVVRNSTFYDKKSTHTGPALEDFKSFDEGLIGGVGVRMPFAGKSDLSLEARYELSKGPSPYFSLKSRYNAVSLLVGVTL